MVGKVGEGIVTNLQAEGRTREMRKGFALNWVVTNDGKALLFGAQDIQALRTLGATVVRFELRLGAASQWSESLIGQFANVAHQLADAGIAAIGLLSNDIIGGAGQAQWNANNWETNRSGGGDNPYLEQWTATAQHLVAGLPMVTLWELWNEPNAWRSRNGAAYTGGSFIYPSLYATLLTRTYPAIKEVQPQSTVITGGLLSHNNHGVMSPQNSGADYLQQVYDALARSGQGSTMPFDAIGQHLYIDQAGHADPDHIRQYLDDIEQVVRRNEGRPDGRLNFITETGWSTTAVSPDVQAANLRTLYAVCGRYPPVAAVCWFQVRDNPAAKLYFGVYTSNWTPKPAATAFQQAPA